MCCRESCLADPGSIRDEDEAAGDADDAFGRDDLDGGDDDYDLAADPCDSGEDDRMIQGDDEGG